MSKRKTSELATQEQQGGNQLQVQPMPYGQNALAAIATSADVAETLAAIHVAKCFPRNLAEVELSIKDNCKRYSFAKAATFAYPRGGQTVTGASIRLAEMILAVWGNAEAGWRELGRHWDKEALDGKGCMVSECMAWCFDKQTNTKRSIAFSVPHLRDRAVYENNRKVGMEQVPLDSERDAYELCANMAARRVRACIFNIIPAWVVEEAMKQIKTTLEKGEGEQSLPDRIRDMEGRYLKMGVTRAMLEARIKHGLDACTQSELADLFVIYQTIKKGEAGIDDFFKPQAPADIQPPAFMSAAAPAEVVEDDEIPGLSPAQADELFLKGEMESEAPQFGTPYGD